MSWYHLALPAPCSAGLTARKTWRHPVTGVPGEVYLPINPAFCSHLEGGEHRWNWRRFFTISPGSLGHLAVLVPCLRFFV